MSDASKLWKYTINKWISPTLADISNIYNCNPILIYFKRNCRSCLKDNLKITLGATKVSRLGTLWLTLRWVLRQEKLILKMSMFYAGSNAQQTARIIVWNDNKQRIRACIDKTRRLEKIWGKRKRWIRWWHDKTVSHVEFLAPKF